MEYFSNCTNIWWKMEYISCRMRVWRQQYISEISALSLKDILYSNSYTLAYTGMHAKTDIFMRNSRIAYECRSRRYCTELRKCRPFCAFIGVSTMELFSRSLVLAPAHRIVFNRSHLYDRVDAYRHCKRN